MATLVITADALFDGTGRVPLRNPAILIEGNRIARVATQDTLDVPGSMPVVDYAGCWLLPGLIDTHSHASLMGRQKHYRRHMGDDIKDLMIRATVNMRDDLRGGVTTIRCMGDKQFLDFTVRKAIEAGEIPGPRIVTSGLGVRTSAGHGFVATVFDGEDEVRRAARCNLSMGADVVKIFVTGDPTPTVIDPLAMSLVEMRAAVEEAHSFGKPVAAHCTGGPAFGLCLEAGVDTLEHSFRITDGDIEGALKLDRTIGFTINTVFNPARVANRHDTDIPEAEFEKQEITKSNYRKYIDAGLRYVVGTDAQHGELPFDLAFMVNEVGVPAEEVLQVATRRAAEVLRVADRVGTVEPGKLADIVAVKGNPLEDMSVLASPAAVMKDGVVYSDVL